jgi:hypothetical protein
MSERNELFDLAVARALEYALRLKLNMDSTDDLQKSLELWSLKTRFAYRISLAKVVSVLQRYPGENSVWQGGKNGQWVKRF